MGPHMTTACVLCLGRCQHTGTGPQRPLSSPKISQASIKPSRYGNLLCSLRRWHANFTSRGLCNAQGRAGGALSRCDYAVEVLRKRVTRCYRLWLRESVGWDTTVNHKVLLNYCENTVRSVASSTIQFRGILMASCAPCIFSFHKKASQAGENHHSTKALMPSAAHGPPL